MEPNSWCANNGEIPHIYGNIIYFVIFKKSCCWTQHILSQKIPVPIFIRYFVGFNNIVGHHKACWRKIISKYARFTLRYVVFALIYSRIMNQRLLRCFNYWDSFLSKERKLWIDCTNLNCDKAIALQNSPQGLHI